MKPLIAFCQSSIGKKWIVAVTGLVLILFVIGHMLGNLQIFLGPETLNAYGAKLQGLGDLLWLIRGFLIVVIVAHIVTTVRLAIQSAAARPQKYAVKKNVAASAGAKTMLLSGLVLISFIVYHLLHFTAQTIHPEWKTWHDAAGQHDIYRMMIAGFQNPLVSGFYILSVFLLSLHLSHGIQSFLQTLGGRTRGFAPAISRGGRILAWAIFAGYAAIPVAVLLGVLTVKGH